MISLRLLFAGTDRRRPEGAVFSPARVGEVKARRAPRVVEIELTETILYTAASAPPPLVTTAGEPIWNGNPWNSTLSSLVADRPGLLPPAD